MVRTASSSLVRLACLALLLLASSATAAPYHYAAQWGTAGTGDGEFNHPAWVAADSSGNIYVADYLNNRIQKFDAEGTYIGQWGSYGSGDGQFNEPEAIAVDDSGYVFVVDLANNRVQKFTGDGVYVSQWGTYGGADGQFIHPVGIAINAGGDIYVSELVGMRVQKFDHAGNYLLKWGYAGSSEGYFESPSAVVVGLDGSVYVADRDNERIQRFTADGVYVSQWGNLGGHPGEFWLPVGLAVDGKGNIYVTEQNGDRVQKFDPDGQYLTTWGSPGSGPGQFLGPLGIMVRDTGSVAYVADSQNDRVQVFSEADTLTLSAIFPAVVGDDGPVTATVSGAGLVSESTIRLVHSGETDIPGGNVQVTPEGDELSATFDLAGAATGTWDVVVDNPDFQSATLPDGLLVQSNAPYEVRVSVLGPTQMRPNRRKAFDVVLENQGNTDLLAVPLWLSHIPEDATVETDFTLAPPPQAGGEPDWSGVPLTLDGPGGKYLAIVIPRLPPGTTVRRFYLTIPDTVTGFELDASVTPPWADGEVFRSCLSSGGVITAPACMGAQLTAINAYMAATPAIQAMSGIGLWAKIAWQCEGAASLPAAVSGATQVLDYLVQPVEGTMVPAGCEVTLVPRWQDRREVAIVTSVDPNDKLGLRGVGTNGQIGSDQLVPYSIRFENLETATAPAQEVTVIDPLDVGTLDISTVSLDQITFGTHVIYPPPGLRSFATEVDLRPAHDLLVEVGASLDQATGILTWSLESIDPATGTLPEDPQVGFLPPDVTPPEGEGSVLFTVMPKVGLDSGTAIRNQASIDFDGATRLTPEWANVLDTTPPQSQVLPLGAVQDSLSFTVRWEAVGSPPDLRDFSVYVSEDGGRYRPWRVQTTATADTIVAPGGRTYAFYSLASDSSGNMEAPPQTPDVETYSRVAVEQQAPPRFSLEGAVPNPAVKEARVWFSLPDREPAVLEVMDVAGRRLFEREVGALGPGRHMVSVSAAAWRPGLYFLKLTQAGQARVSRMVVIR